MGRIGWMVINNNRNRKRASRAEQGKEANDSKENQAICDLYPSFRPFSVGWPSYNHFTNRGKTQTKSKHVQEASIDSGDGWLPPLIPSR